MVLHGDKTGEDGGCLESGSPARGTVRRGGRQSKNSAVGSGRGSEGSPSAMHETHPLLGSRGKGAKREGRKTDERSNALVRKSSGSLLGARDHDRGEGSPKDRGNRW